MGFGIWISLSLRDRISNVTDPDLIIVKEPVRGTADGEDSASGTCTGLTYLTREFQRAS